jgi:hypothetical protein
MSHSSSAVSGGTAKSQLVSDSRHSSKRLLRLVNLFSQNRNRITASQAGRQRDAALCQPTSDQISYTGSHFHLLPMKNTIRKTQSTTHCPL